MHSADRGPAIARTIAHVSLACALLVLAGCALLPLDAAPVPTLTSSPTSVPTTGVPTPEAAPDRDAEVTIAAVDVDGLTVTVAGYVPELAEDGGECTFVISSATAGTFDIESEGIANVTSTSCGTQTISIDRFTRGAWTVQLIYSSAAVEAASQPFPLEIP